MPALLQCVIVDGLVYRGCSPRMLHTACRLRVSEGGCATYIAMMITTQGRNRARPFSRLSHRARAADDHRLEEWVLHKSLAAELLFARLDASRPACSRQRQTAVCSEWIKLDCMAVCEHHHHPCHAMTRVHARKCSTT